MNSKTTSKIVFNRSKQCLQLQLLKAFCWVLQNNVWWCSIPWRIKDVPTLKDLRKTRNPDVYITSICYHLEVTKIFLVKFSNSYIEIVLTAPVTTTTAEWTFPASSPEFLFPFQPQYVTSYSQGKDQVNKYPRAYKELSKTGERWIDIDKNF